MRDRRTIGPAAALRAPVPPARPASRARPPLSSPAAAPCALAVAGRPPRIPRRRIAALCALLCAIAIAGCGAGGPPPIARQELAAAKTFPYYTTYWAGPRFKGHPVTAADGLAAYSPAVGDSVYYGDCLSGRSILPGNGCLLPLQVTTAVYSLHQNTWLGPQRNVLIRGVPAAVFDEGRSIELYTGQLMIDVYSDSYANARAAAQRLQPFNRPGSDRGPLPPPVYCPLLEGPETAAVQAAMASLPGMACQQAASDLARQEKLEEEEEGEEEGEGGG